ncbi:MAG: D-2-hydroxyacid dehydrogenase family protein [Acetobacteraceae bacterium]
MIPAIGVLDDFQDVARGMANWQRLDGRAATTFYTDNVRGAALVERLRPYAVLVAIRERTAFPRSLLAQLPNLRLIATTGMRNRGIDLAACAEQGIVVSGTDTGSSPTAELAFGLILALARNIPAEDRSLRAGQWQTRRLGMAVKGKTLGIVGLGRLGAQLAGYARAFGMELIAWSQNLTEARAAGHGCRLVGKADLFRLADFVSLHLILGERSRGVVGAAELAQMRPSAFLVNTSRAGLVDQAALIAALQAGRIAGAGLDVFDEEPLPPGAAILNAPNTILTPHLGYATQESYEGYFPQVLEAIEAWLAGHPVRLLAAGS